MAASHCDQASPASGIRGRERILFGPRPQRNRSWTITTGREITENIRLPHLFTSTEPSRGRDEVSPQVYQPRPIFVRPLNYHHLSCVLLLPAIFVRKEIRRVSKENP